MILSLGGIAALLWILKEKAYPQDSEKTPRFISSLCDNQEREFTTQDNYHVLFNGASSVNRCEGGSIWRADEGSIPEGGILYFDGEGKFLDICQGLFRSSGCEKFKNTSCESKNYCSA